MKHTVLAMMRDRPGALNRAVSLFRRRNVNIHSLAVATSEAPGVSRMTLVVDAADVEQLTRQLYKLLDVLEVTDVTFSAPIEREMTLLKVHVDGDSRAEVVALCNAAGGRVLDVAATSMVIEMTAAPAELEQFVELMRPFGLEELTRTGRIAMVRTAHVESNGAGATAPGSTARGAWAAVRD